MLIFLTYCPVFDWTINQSINQSFRLVCNCPCLHQESTGGRLHLLACSHADANKAIEGVHRRIHLVGDENTDGLVTIRTTGVGSIKWPSIISANLDVKFVAAFVFVSYMSLHRVITYHFCPSSVTHKFWEAILPCKSAYFTTRDECTRLTFEWQFYFVHSCKMILPVCAKFFFYLATNWVWQSTN